jgi:hypothetical protein
MGNGKWESIMARIPQQSIKDLKEFLNTMPGHIPMVIESGAAILHASYKMEFDDWLEGLLTKLASICGGNSIEYELMLLSSQETNLEDIDVTDEDLNEDKFRSLIAGFITGGVHGAFRALIPTPFADDIAASNKASALRHRRTKDTLKAIIQRLEKGYGPIAFPDH